MPSSLSTTLLAIAAILVAAGASLTLVGFALGLALGFELILFVAAGTTKADEDGLG